MEEQVHGRGDQRQVQGRGSVAHTKAGPQVGIPDDGYERAPPFVCPDFRMGSVAYIRMMAGLPPNAIKGDVPVDMQELSHTTIRGQTCVQARGDGYDRGYHRRQDPPPCSRFDMNSGHQQAHVYQSKV